MEWHWHESLPTVTAPAHGGSIGLPRPIVLRRSGAHHIPSRCARFFAPTPQLLLESWPSRPILAASAWPSLSASGGLPFCGKEGFHAILFPDPAPR